MAWEGCVGVVWRRCGPHTWPGLCFVGGARACECRLVASLPVRRLNTAITAFTCCAEGGVCVRIVSCLTCRSVAVASGAMWARAVVRVLVESECRPNAAVACSTPVTSTWSVSATRCDVCICCSCTVCWPPVSGNSGANTPALSQNNSLEGDGKCSESPRPPTLSTGRGDGSGDPEDATITAAVYSRRGRLWLEELGLEDRLRGLEVLDALIGLCLAYDGAAAASDKRLASDTVDSSTSGSASFSSTSSGGGGSVAGDGVGGDASGWTAIAAGPRVLRRLVQLLSASDAETRLGACMALTKLCPGVRLFGCGKAWR